MESKDKLKDSEFKNRICYYFDDVIGVMDRDSDFDFNGILLHERLYKEKDQNILIYDISYKTSMYGKTCIRFNKIDRFIKTHNGIRCLVLFDYEWLDKISIDSHDSLSIEKILTFHDTH